MTEKIEDLIAEARRLAWIANIAGDSGVVDTVIRLADALEARQPTAGDRESIAKQLHDIGAVRKVDQDCSCQDCEGAAEWVNAPLSVVLDHFKTNVSDAEPTHLVCAWCPQPARGDAWHNDGKLHPSCGQIDHGQGWVPPYTPRTTVPDAATEGESLASEVRRLRESVAMLEEKTKLEIEQRRSAERELSLVRAMPSGQVQSAQLARDLRAERDAALAAIERVQETLSLHNTNGRLVKEVLAALDGAPEPEVSKDAAVLVQVRRYLERFNPGGTHAQNAMAQALENILDGAQVAWSPSDDAPLPVEGESNGDS